MLIARLQLADTQLGLFKKDEAWDGEVRHCELAVAQINRLRPKFVIVCGDLTNVREQETAPCVIVVGPRWGMRWML